MHLPLGLCQLAFSQEVGQAPIETIEEIVVYADQSLHTLRLAVFKAEENFFSVFSALNIDDEYDIRCFYETPTGTRIRQHVCRAYFVTNATSAEAATVRTRGPRFPVARAESVIQSKKRHLRQKMETLLAEHPSLLDALIEYTNAKEVFVAERKRR